MYRNLNSINKKSFKNESVNDLSQINCFFGINGSGKTALANYLLTLNEDRTICFDTNFVEKNISFKDSNSDFIQGIKLKVGHQVEVENQIATLKNKIALSSNEQVDLDAKIKEAKAALYNILTLQLEQAKKEFKTQRIHQKSNAREDPVKAFDYWVKGIDETISIKFENISEIDQKINVLNQQQYVLKSLLNLIQQTDFKALKSMLDQIIIKPDSDLSQTIIDWLKVGSKLHGLNDQNTDTDICLFCQNKFNRKQVEKRVSSLINSQYSNFIEKIKGKNDQIQKIINYIHQQKLSENIFINTSEVLNNIMLLINSKMKKTDKRVSIPDDLINTFNKDFQQIKNQKNNIHNELNETQKIKNRAEDYAKNWIGLSLSQNEKCNEIKNKIKSLEEKLNSIDNNIKANKQKITNLNTKQSDLSSFKNICNRKFAAIGLRLKLEVDVNENGYVIKESSNNPLHLSDLSEGEKRILAFLEFFYQMREDKDKISPNINTIIIDDPITSLDAENSYEIIEMINSLIKKVQKTKCQLFVFTNSSRAFHSIGFSNKDQVKRWNIEKDTNGESHVREIKKEEFLNQSDYYKDLFLEIGKLAFENKNELEAKNNAIFYCNKARLLFESHAYSNYHISTATSSSKNFSKLIEDYDIPNEKEEDFRTDLDILNSNSHGKSNIDISILNNQMDDYRIQLAIRDIIGILYCKDKKHVFSMLDSILNANKKNILKNWAKKWKYQSKYI